MTGNIKLSKTSRRTYFKRKARSLLFSDWPSHILAFVITGACYIGIYQFGSSLGYMFELLTGNTDVSVLFFALYFVLAAAFLIPIMFGLCVFEINAVETGKPKLSDLFCAFGSTRELSFAYRLFFYVVFRIAAAFLPLILLVFFCDNFYYSGIFGVNAVIEEIDVVMFVLNALKIVLGYVGFVVSSKSLIGIYISVKRREKTFSECFLIAGICRRASGNEYVLLSLSFLPLFVVSLFTVGFLLVMYTLPYMLITLTLFSKYLYDKEMYTRNAAFVLYTQNNNNEQ